MLHPTPRATPIGGLLAHGKRWDDMARPPCVCDSSWSEPLVLDYEADAEIQTSEFHNQVETRDRGHIKQQASRSPRDIRPR